MRNREKCESCGGYFKESYSCDTCGDNIITKCQGIPITISFGYGSDLDMEEYHFCGYKCLLKFILDEMKKENPRTYLEFGKEK